jgi:hypothetical protein
MSRIFAGILVSVFCLYSGVLMVPVCGDGADENGIFMFTTPKGSYQVERPGLVQSGRRSHGRGDAVLVWSRHVDGAIYTTTANTLDGYVFAGTYLNTPKEAALFAPDGGGDPAWVYEGEAFYVNAGNDLAVLAAVDQDGQGLNVAKWTGPGDGTPDWTAGISGYSTTSYGPVAVSDDGSTLAVIGSPPGTDAHLLLFDAGSSTPLADYTAAGHGFPRYLKINQNGRYAAFIASATLVVYDRDLLAVRDEIAMGATNSALDISGDGDLVAYGWSNMKVMAWSGTAYSQSWTYSPGSYYVARIAVSRDGSTIVSCWHASQYNTNKIVVHEPGSSAPVWTYDYPVSNGAYQETPYDVDISDDGTHFVVGSWGDAQNLNPEVHVFRRNMPGRPVCTVDMPGSVFCVDISGDGLYATACGKHVHANVAGNGGDIVLVDVRASSRYAVTGPGPGPGNPPRIRVFPAQQDGAHLFEFDAYGPQRYGVNVACGDMVGDGSQKILSGAGPGAIYGPHVRGFRVDGTPVPGLSFIAYGTRKWGVNVTAGNLDSDGYDEIITGAGRGAVFGPHVRAFDFDGEPPVTPVPGVSYFAYGTRKWGVNVTAGDLDDDGYDEIVTAPGPGQVFGPHVRGWNVDGGAASAMPGVSFFAYGTRLYGASAACGDLDGDGYHEIVTAPGPSGAFSAHIRGWNYDGSSITPLPGCNFFAYESAEARYGARVYARADLNADDRGEIMVGTGSDPDAEPLMRSFYYDGAGVTPWFSLSAYPASWTHGVNPAGGAF